jgi:hypothetical protein
MHGSRGQETETDNKQSVQPLNNSGTRLTNTLLYRFICITIIETSDYLSYLTRPYHSLSEHFELDFPPTNQSSTHYAYVLKKLFTEFR